MLIYIGIRLFFYTFLNIILSIAIGTTIGSIIGVIRRRMQDSIYVSVVSAFLGCVLVCITPTISTPGCFESWGDAGGLGSLQVLVCLALIAIGGIVTSIAINLFGFRFMLEKMQLKWLIWFTIAGYIAIAISLGFAYKDYCFPSSSYCYS